MCGVYGFSGVPSKKTTGIVKDLGILNEQRGTDSTGLAFITKKKTCVYKNTIPSSEFFLDNEIVKILCKYRKNDYLTILGHTRFATHGAVTSKNAHPFINKDMIFTHNGVISNFTELSKKHNKKNLQVDSEIIGVLLNKYKSIKRAFKNLEGSYAIPYIDTKDAQVLKVAVHSQVFAYAIRGNQVYYSSSMYHLKEALKKHSGFEFSDGMSDTQYSFYLVGNKIAVSRQDFEVDYKFKQYKYSKTYGSYADAYNAKNWDEEEYKPKTYGYSMDDDAMLEDLDDNILMDDQKLDNWLKKWGYDSSLTPFWHMGFKFEWTGGAWANPELGTFLTKKLAIIYIDATDSRPSRI